MVIFRALQGVAGAFIAPLSQSSMLDVTRRSRHPQVLAIWGMGAMIGPIIGPVLGGWLTENWNWRWVFYVNLPVGLVALAILFAQLPSRQIRKRRFDLFGFAMVALALGGLQLLLDRGNQVDWFASVETWIYLGCAISAAWVGTIHLATARHPLFHRELFADRNFVISAVGMIAVGAVIFSTMALLPPMLQGLFGYDAIDTGLVLAPRGLGVLISMGLSSWLIRRGIEPRWLVAAGFLMTAWTMEWMAGWSLEVDSFHVWGSGFVQGLAVGLVFIPLNASAFATLPAHLRTEGSSLLNLLRSVGSSIGISVVMTLLARGIQRSHEELAGEITANSAGMADLSSLERFQQYGQAGLAMADAEVTRQAAMIAYINDFRLLTWMCLAAVPLVLLMRKNEIHTRR
jgi:DHA2 family multidrug resistance protein